MDRIQKLYNRSLDRKINAADYRIDELKGEPRHPIFSEDRQKNIKIYCERFRRRQPLFG